MPQAKDITKAFKAYQDERSSWAQEGFESSKVFRSMTSDGLTGKLIRWFAKHLPDWVQRRAFVRMSINRPQVLFLPRVEDKGSIRPAFQPGLHTKGPKEAKEPTTVSQDGQDTVSVI
ncbi:hypothetical protein BGX29_011470 [Mortierella sp. GBA35]|nr:hypothetical protein BGX29_011470 [Mortierella sp. GBA35]